MEASCSSTFSFLLGTHSSPRLRLVQVTCRPGYFFEGTLVDETRMQCSDTSGTDPTSSDGNLVKSRTRLERSGGCWSSVSW